MERFHATREARRGGEYFFIAPEFIFPPTMVKRKAARQDADAGSDAENDDIDRRDAEMKRREEEVGAREDALKQREEELQDAEEKFSNEAAKAYGATKPDDVITLNISGTKHQVLRSTLCYVEGSLLASMFSGRWDDNLAKDDQGAFFIDQPYEYFKALLDFFRSCALPAANGPRPSIEAVAGETANNPSFMRMVEQYNCTLEVYPVEIRRFQKGRPKNEPKISQHPNMSVEYHKHPGHGADDMFIYRFSSIGHSRLVARVSFRLDEHEGFAFGHRTSNGVVLVWLTFSPTSASNMLHVPSRQGVWNAINLVEMNERCKRPMPTFAGTKSGDTVQCEFDTSTDGVRFRSVKINDHLVFSSTDSPEDMFGDKKDDSIFNPDQYGPFAFCVRGKVYITDLALA